MDNLKKHIVKPGEYFRPGSHTYVCIRLEDWNQLQETLK